MCVFVCRFTRYGHPGSGKAPDHGSTERKPNAALAVGSHVKDEITECSEVRSIFEAAFFARKRYLNK